MTSNGLPYASGSLVVHSNEIWFPDVFERPMPSIIPEHA